MRLMIILCFYLFTHNSFATIYHYEGQSELTQKICSATVEVHNKNVIALKVRGFGQMRSMMSEDMIVEESINVPLTDQRYEKTVKHKDSLIKLNLKKVQGAEIDTFEVEAHHHELYFSQIKVGHIVKMGIGVFSKTIFEFSTNCNNLTLVSTEHSDEPTDDSAGTITPPSDSSMPIHHSLWDDVDYSYQNSRQLITNKHCYYSHVSFKACIHGLNELLTKRVTTPKIIIPTQALGSFPNIQLKVIASYGQYVVAEFAVKGNNDVGKEYKQTILFIRDVLQQWENYFQTSEVKIDFEALLENVINNYADPNNETLNAVTIEIGHMVMEYYDHAVIYPMSFVQGLQQSDNNYAGLGIGVEEIYQGFIVTEIFSDSTLAQGLQRYDVITHVNNKSVTHLDMIQLIDILRGPVGSDVTLKVRRQLKEVNLVITRNLISYKNVTTKLESAEGQKVGIIKLQSFMPENTCQDVKTAIQQLMEQSAQKLIIDLRGNGGGDATQGECVANLFLEKGSRIGGIHMLYDPMMGGGELDDLIMARPIIAKNEQFSALPLTVLMDSGSASASELVIGALGYNQRAILVGERSFGKGSGQGGTPIGSRQELFGLFTMQRFLVGNNHSHQLVGLLPHLEVISNDVNRVVLREEDMAINPLKAIHTPIERVLDKNIKKCIETKNIVNRDNQLEMALKVSICQ